MIKNSKARKGSMMEMKDMHAREKSKIMKENKEQCKTPCLHIALK